MILALLLCACQSTGWRSGQEIFHDGSLAENTALDVLKVERPDGTKLTRVKVGKDQQNSLNKYLLMQGLPAILETGGEALSGVTDSVADGVKSVSQ